MTGFTVQETVEDFPWIGKIARHTSSAADPDSWKQSLQWCAAVRHLNVFCWPIAACRTCGTECRLSGPLLTLSGLTVCGTSHPGMDRLLRRQTALTIISIDG